MPILVLNLVLPSPGPVKEKGITRDINSESTRK